MARSKAKSLCQAVMIKTRFSRVRRAKVRLSGRMPAEVDGGCGGGLKFGTGRHKLFCGQQISNQVLFNIL